jgi:FMN-dependent oxidoreductase (nitrilotriacetate monooxygenase family)
MPACRDTARRPNPAPYPSAHVGGCCKGRDLSKPEEDINAMAGELHLVALSAIGTLPGAGSGSPGAAVAGLVDDVVALARRVEEAQFDAVLLADFVAGPADPAEWKDRSANYVDPIVLTAAIIQRTSTIGVIPTLSSSFEHPYGIARQILSLDHLSAGRIGWNVVTSMVEGAFHSHGLATPPSHGERYGRAREAVEIAFNLWDSFDEAGDPGTARATRYDGDHLRTRSVLGLPRSPQGRPVIVQAGQSEDGLAFASKFAEAVFVGKDTRQGTKAIRDALHAGATRIGRTRPALALSSLGFIIAPTREQALALERQASERTPLASQLLHIEKYFEAGQWIVDPDNLDAPLPPFPERTELRQTGLEYYRRIASERPDWTVREFLHRTRGGHMFHFVGSYDELADEMERFAAEGAADGFVIAPRIDRIRQLDAFIAHVLPTLRRRGLFRERYTGSTLRDHFGLDAPPRAVAVQHSPVPAVA